MVNPKEAISLLKDQLEKNSHVVALVSVGSHAREDIYIASKFSDMEAYIVVRDNQTDELEKQLPEIVKKIGPIIFYYKNQVAGFSTVFEDLFRLELPVVKESDLASVFSRPKAQPVKVLIDKTNGKLEEALKNRPESLDFETLFINRTTDFWYMATLAVQYYKKGEFYNSRSALQFLQSALIKLFELLKDPKILLLESNKRIEQFLSSEQIELLREVSPSYNNEQIKQALQKIIDIFPQTAKQVAEKYHYDYNPEIEENIKPKLKELLK